MPYKDDDFLMLSDIQHFQFCKRQWGLIRIDQAWCDNEATTHGQILHQKVDNPYIKEKRPNLLISRAMPVSSKTLGLSGILDAVEFHKHDDGIPLVGRRGRWIPTIVEYKRGKPKNDQRDIVQLVAQTICLEETLACSIHKGYLYYHAINKRIEITIDQDIRQHVYHLAEEMHHAYQQKIISKAEYFKNCRLCSLVDICMPRLSKKTRNITNYIQQAIHSEEEI